MTQAGWYPDPAGHPQTYRYWDGTSWSQETTGDPYAPPPYPATPPPPPPIPPQSGPPPSQPPSLPPTPGGLPPATVLAGGVTPPAGYGQVPAQPSYGGFPPAPPPTRVSRVVVFLIVGAVLLLAGLSVAGFVGYRALAGDDDNDASNDTSSAIDTETGPTGSTPPTTDTTGPSESTSTAESTPPTDQQCNGGQPTPATDPPADATEVSGGGIAIPVPRGYAPEVRYAAAFAWADDFIPLQKTIETGDDYSWVSIYGVGAVPKANGFDDPAQAAEVVMTCMAQSTDLYQYFTGRETLSSGAITVDGYEAFQITANLRVDDPNISLEGDVAQVVVIDTGDPDRFGLYVTVVPIGDAKLIRQQAAMVGEIDVD